MHPRLTVISGVAENVRAALADEIIGAMSATRSGIHLELVEDDGRQLVVFRPSRAAHRVVDVASGSDLSDEFRSSDGRIDLLRWQEIDSRLAQDLLLFDANSKGPANGDDATLSRLAEVDQASLWSAASRVRITADEYREASGGLEKSGDEETAAIIERRHQAYEQADQRAERFRRMSTVVAAVAAALAVPTWVVSPASSVPMVAIAAISMLLVFVYRARAESIHRAERAALAEAGADSYLGYMVHQVDEIFDGTEKRKRLSAVADDHRSAAIRWTDLAGAGSVEGAFEHHDEIAAPAELRRQLRTLGRVSAGSSEVDEDVVDMAQSLVAHMARLRRGGREGESLPLILDDPFGSLGESARVELLELLHRTCGPPQVILLTDDPVVASWARPRALAGDLGMVEPGNPDSGQGELAV